MGALGIIGGSGLYQMSGVEGLSEERISTPFGDPSDAYLRGRLAGRDVVFLARHGRGHRLLPSEINFRANIYGFKKLGVTRLVSVSAVGSMKEGLRPLDVVLPDQFIDWTRNRPSTFFGAGLVAHVSLADPVCPTLAGALAGAGEASGVRLHRGGGYLCIEGSFGVDVIGMTNVQEVKLAREAEICYATMAMVTDFDCWRQEDEPVTVQEVVARLHDNARTAQAILTGAVTILPEKRGCACSTSLANAILTDRASIPPATRERLRPIVGRYLDGE